MNSLEPYYHLTSDKYFSDTLIPELYMKVMETVGCVVKEINHVSLTTDLCSSLAQASYLSLTAYLITSKFEREQGCFHAVSLMTAIQVLRDSRDAFMQSL